MAKVYEALKQAEMEREAEATGTGPFAFEQTPAKKGERVGMEQAMMRLYQAIGSALPCTSRKIVQFVSSHEGEGTSTIVRELARVSAQRMGKSVLVIDADRTRPMQHRFFGVSARHYIEDSIRNGGSAENMTRQPGSTGVSVSLLSRQSTSVCELFDSWDTNVLFDALKKQFDLVLIDSSSVTASPDCLSICARVDGVVLVVEAENTRWPIAEAAKDRIVKNGGNILGIVLNKRKFRIPGFIYRRL